MNKKCQKGITLLALTITIVILTIIASVGIYGGKEVIQRAKLEELKTDMLLIQAKAKEYVEDATFKMGMNPDDNKKTQVRSEVYEETAKLSKVSSVPSNLGITEQENCYKLTDEAVKSWALEGVEAPDEYIIQFKEDDVSVEIYYIPGQEGKYSLSDIDKLEE